MKIQRLLEIFSFRISDIRKTIIFKYKKNIDFILIKFYLVS